MAGTAASSAGLAQNIIAALWRSQTERSIKHLFPHNNLFSRRAVLLTRTSDRLIVLVCHKIRGLVPEIWNRPCDRQTDGCSCIYRRASQPHNGLAHKQRTRLTDTYHNSFDLAQPDHSSRDRDQSSIFLLTIIFSPDDDDDDDSFNERSELDTEYPPLAKSDFMLGPWLDS